MWIIYPIISGLCATMMAVVINTKLRGHDALLMTCLFCVIMTILLIISCLLMRKFDGFSLKDLSQQDIIALILTGFFAGAGYVAYFLALKKGPINHVVAIDRLSIVYLVLISIFFLQTKGSIGQLAGALLMFAGAYLISM